MGWADGMGVFTALGKWYLGHCNRDLFTENEKKNAQIKWDTCLKACPAGQGLNKIPWFEKGQKPGRC